MLSEGRVRTRRQYREYQRQLEEKRLQNLENVPPKEVSHDESGDAQMFKTPIRVAPISISPKLTPPPSTKRQSKLRSNTPRPPALPRVSKTAPIFNRSQSRLIKLNDPRAYIVSFKPKDFAPKLSPLYNPSKCITENYIQQCFELMGTLGSGSFGKVIRVKSKDDGNLYAIKCSMEPFHNMSHRCLRLEEVKKHEILPDHPNIVKFICAWEEEGRLYMQTELCERSLNDICETEHEIPEGRVWCYFIDVLLGVHHLHVNGLIHVDIKPENIFVSCNDVCKLGDFGLVCDERNDNVTIAMEGDSKYLASEVLNDRPTKAADIFSLGITLLEIATDMDLPKYGRYWTELRNGNIPETFLEKLSQELKTVVLAMLDPTPSLRPTTTELLNMEIIRSRMNWRHRRIYQQYKNGKKEFYLTLSIIDTFIWLFLMLTAFMHFCYMPIQRMMSRCRTDVLSTPAYVHRRKSPFVDYSVRRTPECSNRLGYDDSPLCIPKSVEEIQTKMD